MVSPRAIANATKMFVIACLREELELPISLPHKFLVKGLKRASEMCKSNVDRMLGGFLACAKVQSPMMPGVKEAEWYPASV